MSILQVTFLLLSLELLCPSDMLTVTPLWWQSFLLNLDALSVSYAQASSLSEDVGGSQCLSPFLYSLE